MSIIGHAVMVGPVSRFPSLFPKNGVLRTQVSPSIRGRLADTCGALTEHAGGVTAFMRAPAHGTTEDKGQVQHDDIVIMEVMTEALDRNRWASYRTRLEEEFGQDEIVIRVTG